MSREKEREIQRLGGEMNRNGVVSMAVLEIEKKKGDNKKKNKGTGRGRLSYIGI